MKKSKGHTLFCAFSWYFAFSLLATAVILLGSLGAVRLWDALFRIVLGLEPAYWFKPAISDAAAFALISALTALVQYYMVSLLALCRSGRGALFAASGCSALFSGIYFWRAAELSSLGTYALSGLPVTMAALIGGAAAITQKAEENPWPAAYSRLFSCSPRF